MTLTKRSTVLLTVFFLGLIALAADRTILRPQGGPGAASAASESETLGLLADNLPVLENKAPEAGMTERLSSLWSGKEPVFDQVRNPFALPTTWFDSAGAAGAPIPDAASRFMRTHRLTAVVVNDDKSYAVVDDRFLVPGRILDGFTLVSVEDRSAVFECEGKQAILELIGPEEPTR
jgi:hypothetical protein